MGFCKDCKHWCHVPQGSWPRLTEPCTGTCEHLGPNPQGFRVGYSVLDDSGLETWLETTPEFGCINFQERI